MPTNRRDTALFKVLAGTSLLRDLGSNAVAEVASAARTFSLATDEVVFRQGQPADAVYLLCAGRMKLQQAGCEGQTVLLRVFAPGDLLGLVATLAGSTYPATAVAARRCHGMRWRGETLHDIMQRHPRIALNVQPVLIDRLHEMQDQFRELATESVERRLARALVRLVRQAGRPVQEGIRLGMPLGRQDLAEMAGTSLFTASRILCRWDEEHIIRSSRKRVMVLAPERLIAIAEDLPAAAAGAKFALQQRRR